MKTSPPPVVLVVDDEAVVTQSLAAFLDLETDYQVIQTQSPHDAIEIAKTRHVDLIISDYLMPSMNGIELLKKIKELQPDTPRIMLTGYADKENTIRAINDVGLFQYIEKPWDNDLMLLVIRNALASKSLGERLSERIHELDRVLLERNRLAERDDRLRAELALARRIQASMLPSMLPSRNGIELSALYEPALEIGGDFYDTIPLTGDRVAALIADTTGHGIQAALSTAVLKFAFTSFANRDASATDIICGMNKTLAKGLPEETYAAALVAVIDMASGECRIANAGIPTPFLLKRAKRAVERVPAHGFMLGVMDNELYRSEEERRVPLEVGDFLCFYTDGLSEAENRHGVQFDHEALARVMLEHAASSGDDLTRALMAASKVHAHSGHEWDDIAIVGIDRR